MSAVTLAGGGRRFGGSRARHLPDARSKSTTGALVHMDIPADALLMRS
jgi:hypothetical protein